MNHPIEAISICVNYADTLEVTLPHNKDQFDRLLIVTAPEDERTIAVCEENGVRCLATDGFYRDAAPFNKGAGINEGFLELERSGWIVHFDCDMIIPFDLREELAGMELDRDKMYTMPRYIIKNYKDYQRWNAGGISLDEFPYSLVTGLGYFQLFHAGASALAGLEPGAWHPEGPRADRVDVQFRLQWPAVDTIDQPLIHLGQPELNWMGRRSKSIFTEFLHLIDSEDLDATGRLQWLKEAVSDHFGSVVVLSTEPVDEDRVLDCLRLNDLALTADEKTIMVQCNRKTLELIGVAAEEGMTLLEAVGKVTILSTGPITGPIRHQVIG